MDELGCHGGMNRKLEKNPSVAITPLHDYKTVIVEFKLPFKFLKNGQYHIKKLVQLFYLVR